MGLEPVQKKEKKHGCGTRSLKCGGGGERGAMDYSLLICEIEGKNGFLAKRGMYRTTIIWEKKGRVSHHWGHLKQKKGGGDTLLDVDRWN